MSPLVLRSISLGCNYSHDAFWHRLNEVFQFLCRYNMMPARDYGFDQLLLIARTSLRNENLQTSPQVFDGIQIRAVSWPRKQLHVVILEPCLTNFSCVARCTVLLKDEVDVLTEDVYCGLLYLHLQNFINVNFRIDVALHYLHSSNPCGRHTCPYHNRHRMFHGGKHALGQERLSGATSYVANSVAAEQ